MLGETTVREVFQPGGLLDQQLDNYRFREQQLEMAEAVDEAIFNAQHLITEAGTGTGKTLAYLIPALLSGRRVIVSTASKTLQDQIAKKDLPLLRRVLDIPFRISVLKGRANYLCELRYQRNLAQPGFAFEGGTSPATLKQVSDWAKSTVVGDRAELSAVPENHPLWRNLTSTADNCYGSQCENYEDCFVVAARRAAQEADVVVVNHHLLFADLALKDAGFGAVMPGADVVVVDEAHQLASVASQFLGVSVSSRQVVELLSDLRAESERLDGLLPNVTATLTSVEAALNSLNETVPSFLGKQAWEEAIGRESIAALSELDQRIAEVVHLLGEHAKVSENVAALQERAISLRERSAQMASTERQEDSPEVRWVERTQRGFSLHSAPLDIASRLQALVSQSRANWVLTSATLSVDGKFDHLAQSLGFESASRLLVESPFVWEDQALLYLPKNLPEPNEPRYSECWLETILPLVDASNGGAFVLCTSHRIVEQATQWLRNRTDYEVFSQQDAPRAELLAAFAKNGNAVLVGTTSFWEGVDVQGQALRLVVIDRLPFAAPDDPLLKARSRHLREQGKNPFSELQIPEAVIMLRQGVGRLIRSESDAGVIVICDPRLRSKYYGKLFLNSLPPIPSTSSGEVAADFLRRLPTDQKQQTGLSAQ